MMNKYIAALLVILAATGMEAHTYQSALKFAVGNLSYEEFIKQPQARALEDDLLAIIKAIKKAKHDLKQLHQYKSNGTGAAHYKTNSPSPTCFLEQDRNAHNAWRSLFAHGYWKSIVIRGPCLP